MSPCLHIVGAGLSGLGATLLASGRHWRVVLHEGTRMVGGRCRTIQQVGRQYENDTHALLQANRQTLRLLQMIGAVGRWAEPERGVCRSSTLLPAGCNASTSRPGNGSDHSVDRLDSAIPTFSDWPD